MRQYRIILSADTASEVRQMLSQKRGSGLRAACGASLTSNYEFRIIVFIPGRSYYKYGKQKVLHHNTHLLPQR